ncbi:MAG TPA: hypothetical protein VFE98_10760 [Candidatus Bathyarchaeia archaeon]|nr:hypothetical protein [Candidatus Bathyarchaeia archaeon]
MLIQANAQHPNLLSGKLPWFGTDGEADNIALVNNATVAPLLAKVKMVSTLFAPTNNTRSTTFYTAYAQKYTGYTCDSYCLGAYDDVWLGALATLQAGSYDGAKIQAAMPTVASNYFGVTGWMGLQPSGDRIPTSYQIWKVNAGQAWVLAGNWDNTADAITWTSAP